MFSSHGRQNSEMELILQIGGITRLNMPPVGSAPVPQTGHAAALAGGIERKQEARNGSR